MKLFIKSDIIIIFKIFLIIFLIGNSNQIEFKNYYKFNVKSLKNLSFSQNHHVRQIKFINDSSKFESTDQINTSTSIGQLIKGDFTIKFFINKLQLKGFSGIGLSTFQYPDNKMFLNNNQWVGMIKLEKNQKQWLLTDNFVIAENGKWKDNPNASFKEGDQITIFRNKSDIGFRINDFPNDYKYDFPEDLYFVLCLKAPNSIVEAKSFIKRSLDFGKAGNSNSELIESILSQAQQRVGNNDISMTAHRKIMEALFNKNNSAKGVTGSNTLEAGSSIYNSQVLVSPNGIYSVEIRNAELLVVENSGKSNEGILWKNGTSGNSKGEKQILGLLNDATLYLQTDGINDYYWTNKDRKSRKGFTPPFAAKIKDNGEFVIEDKNYSIIWTTNSAVVNSNNSIGDYLDRMVPLSNQKCIISENRKRKLCNNKGGIEVIDTNNKITWNNYSAKDKIDASLILQLNCNLNIKNDEKNFWSVPIQSDSCVLIVNDKGYLEIKKQKKSEVTLWTSNPLNID